MKGWIERHRAATYVAAFIALTLLGMAALLLPAVDRIFTQPFTRALVFVCALVMNLFGAGVHTYGVVLAFAKGPGAVTVASGCNAVEVCLLFAAAIAPFPAPWKARAIGIAAGVAAIQALNLVRIISLLLLSRYAMGLFEFFHLYVWDALIMLDGIVLFLSWHQWQSRRWPSEDVQAAA